MLKRDLRAEPSAEEPVSYTHLAPLVAAPFERTCERCEQVAPDGIGIVVVLPHLGSLPPQQAL